MYVLNWNPIWISEKGLEMMVFVDGILISSHLILKKLQEKRVKNNGRLRQGIKNVKSKLPCKF